MSDDLPPSMMRDPFDKAQLIQERDTEANRELRQVLGRLLAKAGREGGVPLLVEPHDGPKRVIDAKRYSECAVCRKDVWLSPSSLPRMEEMTCVIVCMRCFDEEAA